MAEAAVAASFEFEEASGGIQAFRHRQNGLQVLVLPEHAVPVVAFMVTYRVGSRDEKPGLTGATHFLEHLMFKGTDRFNKAAGTSVFNVLQRVGGQVNATTWLDRTNYYSLLPSRHLPLAVEVEADRMRGARIDPAEVERERTVILNEYDRGRNEPLRSLYEDVWSTAYLAHPYHHPTIGWRADIETVTAEGLRGFYDTFYWPRNATVSLIGDVTVEQGLALVDAHFGSIPAGPALPPHDPTREPDQQGERRVVVRRPGQLGAVLLAFKSPPAQDPDVDALDVLGRVLAAGKNSRLYRRLTDRGLTTSLMASASRLRDPGLFYLYAFLAPQAGHEQVEADLLDALRAVAHDGVSVAEVERAKTQLRAQQAFGRDGPFGIAAQLNEAIAAGDWRLYTTLLDRIENVTPDDVQRVAAAYADRQRMTAGWYVPELPEAAPTT